MPIEATPDNLISDEHYEGLISAFEWMYQKEVELVNKTPPGLQSCDPGCPGWFLSSGGKGAGREVQRCDTCEEFGDDHAALTYVLTRIGGAMERRHNHLIDKQEAERRRDYGPEPS